MEEDHGRIDPLGRKVIIVIIAYFLLSILFDLTDKLNEHCSSINLGFQSYQ